MAGNPIRKSSIFLLALATALMVRTAAAQGPSDADKQFVRTAVESNNAEIAAAHWRWGRHPATT